MIYMDGKRAGVVRSVVMESTVTYEYQYDPTTNPAATVQSIEERLKNYAPLDKITEISAVVASQRTEIDNRYTKTETDAKIDEKINAQKAAKNGVATLNENGVIPESQLPAYVDDVLEYDTFANFPEIGESGKIYLDKDANRSYRWSGSQYAALNSGLALGETSSTAYSGEKGKQNAENISKNANAIADLENNVKNGTVVAGKATQDGSGNNIEETYQKIAQTAHLYVHYIVFYNKRCRIAFQFLSTRSEEFTTVSDLCTELSGRGYIPASGVLSDYTPTGETESHSGQVFAVIVMDDVLCVRYDGDTSDDFKLATINDLAVNNTQHGESVTKLF